MRNGTRLRRWARRCGSRSAPGSSPSDPGCRRSGLDRHAVDKLVRDIAEGRVTGVDVVQEREAVEHRLTARGRLAGPQRDTGQRGEAALGRDADGGAGVGRGVVAVVLVEGEEEGLVPDDRAADAGTRLVTRVVRFSTASAVPRNSPFDPVSIQRVTALSRYPLDPRARGSNPTGWIDRTPPKL